MLGEEYEVEEAKKNKVNAISCCESHKIWKVDSDDEEEEEVQWACIYACM